MATDNNNDGPPPIEPVQKTILKNETPAFVSTAASNVLLFLEKYGWFVLFGIVAAIFIWSKLKPYWRKWKEKRDKRIEEENIGKA
ncbi:seleno S-like [Paramuricea clavata]|uniref:Seleno S-like n=1 Tax=Paramuricea clavata TaxID=317549 RepID=A0A6S7K8P5_PARCT|nr:seleno S-like [Paramuricea clavata]